MRIVQVATTYGDPCGIGNFARGLEAALRDAGVTVETVTGADETLPAADVTLIQHEWGVFESSAHVRALARASAQPVVLFAHSRGEFAERFDDVVAGYAAMAPGVVADSRRPVHVMAHPAYVPAVLSGRAALRARYGLDPRAYTLGSSGFARDDHEFPQLLERLLPRAAARGWRVELAATRWTRTPGELIARLEALRATHPAVFRFTTEFQAPAALNERLQACDLLWCWTREPSTPYASGSISDHYASGTRIVASDRLQYAHVTRLPNVVCAPAELGAFVDRLVAEADSGTRTRHDPAPIGWARHAAGLACFLGAVRAA